MDDKTKTRIEIWKVSQETLQHFNSLQLQLRNFALTVFVAMLTGAGFALKERLFLGTTEVRLGPLAFWICGIGAFVTYGFYVMDRGYHALLKGANDKLQETEKLLNPELPEAGLATSVTNKSNEGKILLWKNSSTHRLRFFYSMQWIVFAAAGVASFFIATIGAEPNGAPTVRKAIEKDWPRDALKKFVDSGAYEKQVAYVTNAAERYLAEKLSTNLPAKPVAVFDIDETAISTWVILEQGNFSWDPQRFSNFVGAGHGTAIKPALGLFTRLRDAGIPVVFLTGRSESVREGTMRALEREGYSGYEALYMKPESEKRSTGEFKAAVRASIEASGRTIVMCVGDKPEDLRGSGSQSDFLLPNPFY